MLNVLYRCIERWQVSIGKKAYRLDPNQFNSSRIFIKLTFNTETNKIKMKLNQKVQEMRMMKTKKKIIMH